MGLGDKGAGTNCGPGIAFTEASARIERVNQMATKTNLKAGYGKLAANHNETLVRDCGKNLQVKTRVRAGKKLQ
jgi:hypothetical protein